MQNVAKKIAGKAISSAVDAVTLSSEQRDRLIETLPTHRAWIPQPHRCELGYAAPSFECDALLPDRTVGKVRSCDYYATPEADEESGKDAQGDRNKASNMWVLLLFYPADFSFICATELLALSGAAERFRRECNCQVMACSTDTVYAHRAWCSLPRSRGGLSLNDGSERRFEQPLGFPLLSDVSRAVSRDFGVLFPAGSEHAGMAMCGTFLIDPNGLVRHMAVQEMSIARSIPELLRVTHGYVRHAATGELLPHGWRIGTPGVRTKAMMEVGQATSDSIAQSKIHQEISEAQQGDAHHPGLLSRLTHAIFGDDDAAAAASAAEVSGAEAKRAIDAAKRDAKREADREIDHGNAAIVKGPMDAANRAKEGTQIHDMISSLDLKHTPNLGPAPQTTPPVSHIETVNTAAILQHQSPAPHAMPPPPQQSAQQARSKQPQQAAATAATINLSPHAIRKTDDAAKAHLSLNGAPTLKGASLLEKTRGTAGAAAAPAAKTAAATRAAPTTTARAASQEAQVRPIGTYGYPGAAAASAASASRRRAASADPSVNHMIWSLTNAAILDYDDVGAGGAYFSALRQHPHVVEAAPPIVHEDVGVRAAAPPSSNNQPGSADSGASGGTRRQQSKNQPPTADAAWSKVETQVPAAFGGPNLRKDATQQPQQQKPQTGGDEKGLDVEVWHSGSGIYGAAQGAEHPHHTDDNGVPPVRVAAMSHEKSVLDEIDRHTHHA